MKGVIALAAVAAALVMGTATGAARTADATATVYPSGTSFTATGAAPKHGGSSIALAMPIGATDDAVILARGAAHISAVTTIDPALQIQLLYARYVSVDGHLVPDALEPWDGSNHATDETNQPVWVQVTVPQGTAPGTYPGSVTLTTDGTPHVIAVSVDVANVTIPPPGQVAGSLLTAFNVSPQSYGAEVEKLYGIPASQSLPGLFSFLSAYRISPNNWGYGNPSSKSGYTSGGGWNEDKAARMEEAVGSPRQFSSMWIPISSNRATPHERVAGVSPFAPHTWCPYLKAVRRFWENQGWIPGAFPYVWGIDEPGPKTYPVVAGEAKALHSCWPGAALLTTSKPGPDNRILWNGGSDDVDIWTVLESRYYGEYTTPSQRARGENRSTMFLRNIDQVRRKGKQVWTYTYDSPAHKTPGFALSEAVSDPRMFADWAALENITGLLRGQGMTTYDPKTNPLTDNSRADGDFVLIYPGRDAPVASARLEELREGIEDWEILNVVRQKHGSAAVRKLLAGLFTSKLACTIGCPIKNSLPYAWPLWSHNAATATKLEQMRANALAAAS